LTSKPRVATVGRSGRAIARPAGIGAALDRAAFAQERAREGVSALRDDVIACSPDDGGTSHAADGPGQRQGLRPPIVGRRHVCPERTTMTKTSLRPENLAFLPKPEYPYSPGSAGGGLVYTSGQVAWNSDGRLVGLGDPAAQTRQVLSNVESVLREGGATLSDVLKCNVYLADMRYFQAMNDAAASFFPAEPPARTTVQAPLAEPEMLVEIEAIAWIG
jgi:2-iminobutanoate/2-iminopropanoate deaminase